MKPLDWKSVIPFVYFSKFEKFPELDIFKVDKWTVCWKISKRALRNVLLKTENKRLGFLYIKLRDSF